MAKLVMLLYALVVINTVTTTEVTQSLHHFTSESTENLLRPGTNKNNKYYEEPTIKNDLRMIATSAKEGFRNMVATIKQNINNFSDKFSLVEHIKADIKEHNEILSEEIGYRLKWDPRVWAKSGLDFAVLNKDENVGKRQAPIVLDKTGPVPDSFDWRKFGVIPSIKHQGYCESDGIFAITDGIDALHMIKYGVMLGFSQQHPIDCMPFPKDQLKIQEKCERIPKVEDAVKYLQENGLRLLRDYSYEGKGGDCKSSTTRRIDIQFKIKHIKNEKGNEPSIKEAVYRDGPVMVTLRKCAVWPQIQIYWDGVFDVANCEGEVVMDVGLIVGYGHDKRGRPYWIVKFSFGKHFGDNGYIMIARGKNTRSIEEHAISLELISSSEDPKLKNSNK